jgi:hypothetical protein
VGQTIAVVNIERGMPSIDVARQRLIAAIDGHRCAGTSVLKIIHGYGSSGAGGKLRVALRKSLNRRRSESKVARIIYGERWSIFDPETQKLLSDYPDLDRDGDLDRYNQGITIVELCEDQRQSGQNHREQ